MKRHRPLTAIDVKIASLNHFGTGDHPWADEKNLRFFTPSYLRECLARAVASPEVSDAAKQVAQAILDGEREESFTLPLDTGDEVGLTQKRRGKTSPRKGA